MLDFDGIVLSALQNTFSRPVTVTPVVSLPGAAAYANRGVYSTGPVDLLGVPDGVFSDQQTRLWIRLSEYATPPVKGDQVEIAAYLTAPAEGKFEVQDVDRYADGKLVLALKKLQTQ